MMKCVLVIALSAAFILATVAASADETSPKPCTGICTMESAPVCGYDGNCYKQYPNKCGYDFDKCSRKNNLETVDMSLCELADKNNHPNYKTCAGQ